MINIKIKDKEYFARLSAKTCVELEKKLGTNPLNVFTTLKENELPSIEQLLIILYAALKDFNKSVTMDKVYDLYDDYCEEGGDIASLLQLEIEIFMDAGFIPKKKDKSKN